MRYEKGHRESTRQHIVDVASRKFREDGIAAAGLAGLMKDAGLTNGAFYNHFESKEDLVRESLGSALDQRRDRSLAAAQGGAGVEAAIRDYLSANHRDNPGSGCVASALLGEIARQPRKTRSVYTTKLAEYVELIALSLPGPDLETRRRVATSLYAMMIGALQLSRAVSDKKMSDEILSNGIEAALRMIDMEAGSREVDQRSPARRVR